MGVVYKARQRNLDRLVALKMILAGAARSARADGAVPRRSRGGRPLQHPHIVQIHEVGEHGGLPFLSLEFVSGGTLARRLAGTPQPARHAAELVEMLARAVPRPTSTASFTAT